MRRILLLLTIMGCGESDNDRLEQPPVLQPRPDRTDELFLPDRLLNIEIQLSPADWDTLRWQTRTMKEIFGGECLEDPFNKPFTYFHADVTVDGETFQNVGLRKKGFLGSLSTEKPSLKIKFHEYVPGQNLLGLKRMTLNNAKQDPAFIKQCIGYDLFRAAGVPAPRCNFARVTVNGDDLGIFAHVESIKKDFLARHFVNNEGNLYEATLSDFRDGWMGTFEKKTNKTLPDQGDLQEIATALEATDETLLSQLTPLIDIDAFIDFWIMEVLIAHWDGYAGNTNNTYFYHDPTSDQFQFIPWGIDGILHEPADFQGPRSVMATGYLARRLYLLEGMRQRYFARMTELLELVWDTDALLGEVDRMEALITPHEPDVAEAIEAVRTFIFHRAANLADEIAAGGPILQQPLREAPCLEELGNIAVSFDTDWGSIGREDIFNTTSGTFTGMVGEYQLDVRNIGAVAGWDPEAEVDTAIIQVVGLLADGSAAIAHFVVLNPSLVAPGNTIPLDLTNGYGALFHWDPATEESRLVGYLFDGELTLSEAQTTDGAPVVGSVATTVVQWGL